FFFFRRRPITSILRVVERRWRAVGIQDRNNTGALRPFFFSGSYAAVISGCISSVLFICCSIPKNIGAF
ncbi:hypothetical protein, partial [Escherichia coli]|uniref:hypothetical protein n=1 Tax=Escherichia coli TaxID=562 RepID=UPI001BAE6763